MNAIRLLAMMTARGVKISVAGGGKVEISRADVAAGMSFASVSVTADRLVRYLYCDDSAQEPLLLAALVHELRRSVPVERPMLYQLVRLALAEISSCKPCRSCNGYGTVAAQPCEVCCGAGIKSASQRERSAVLNVALSTFQRSYEAHADTVYQYVAAMANGALAALAEQFSDRAA